MSIPNNFPQRTAAAALIVPVSNDGTLVNSVIIDQSRTITRLQKQLEILGETLRGQDVDRAQPHNQKPPHYAP